MSRIYKPHRTMGLVSNDVPAVLQTRGADHFVTTCVGRSLNTYNVSLHYLFVLLFVELYYIIEL
jgi:U3 small nucleolar RNA-associated protein 21